MLKFNETPEAEFSTISALSRSDHHAKRRQRGKQYAVETISLRDLLRAHNAPLNIDYLSIDTEGSEFAILNGFLPSHYEVRIITVEHNYTDQRSRIHGLLTSCGYSRVLQELSIFDDWYIIGQQGSCWNQALAGHRGELTAWDLVRLKVTEMLAPTGRLLAEPLSLSSPAPAHDPPRG
jgi:Methyltransferase FkbM domain